MGQFDDIQAEVERAGITKNSSLRFNIPRGWWDTGRYGSIGFYGFLEFLFYLQEHIAPTALGIIDGEVKPDHKRMKMMEVGSYAGESTLLFSSTGLFDEVISIDPHDGDEEMNRLRGVDWDSVKKTFNNITELSDVITHYPNYSFDGVLDKFEDGYFNLIYLDGEHDYESVKRDLESLLPKINPEVGWISGHDFINHSWPGCVSAIREVVGEPDATFRDGSWVKKI